MNFCGEIQYKTTNGNVHSDICYQCGPHLVDYENNVNDEYRQFLHNCLDEWLNKSNGTGAFWVGDPTYFNDWGL